MTAVQTDWSSETLLDAILSSLQDDKAEDVTQIDLRGKSEMADYMVICSGRSSRQVASISEKLTERLKERFSLSSKVEGADAGDWVLIDAGDVIVHVFRQGVGENREHAATLALRVEQCADRGQRRGDPRAPRERCFGFSGDRYRETPYRHNMRD